MKSRSGEKIKLTSIDELLGVVNEESAMEIEINRIHAFKDHPFKVLDKSPRILLILQVLLRYLISQFHHTLICSCNGICTRF